jgi:hypothetical protein
MTEFLMSMCGGFVGAVLGYVAAVWAMRRQPIRDVAMAAIAKELTDQGLGERIAERLDELA